MQINDSDILNLIVEELEKKKPSDKKMDIN